MKTRILILLVLICCNAVTLAQEQDAPTPTQSVFNVDFDYAVAFPQRMALTATFRGESAELLEEVILQVEVPNSEPVRVAFPADRALGTGSRDAVITDYDYIFDSNNLPPLFSEIDITWTATNIIGQTETFTDTVQFADARVNWETVSDEADRVTLTYPGGTISAGVIFERVMQLYDLLQSSIGDTLRFQFMIYPQNVPPGCDLNRAGEPVVQITLDGVVQLAPCNLPLAVSVIEEAGYTIVSDSESSNYVSTLLDAMFNAFYEPRWGDVDVPEWFRYALRQFVELTPNPQALTVSRTALRTGAPYMLADMNERPTADPARQRVWDAQAQGMLRYLIDRIGTERLFLVAQSIGQAGSFETAYQNITGESVEMLIPGWEVWVYSRRADNMYTFTPYLEMTPTPTPTPTLTPTPTATPTMTPEPETNTESS